MIQRMLARYYLLPTIGRLSLCMVECESSSHDYSAIYSACSSLSRTTTRLMVRAFARLLLWEYYHQLKIRIQLTYQLKIKLIGQLPIQLLDQLPTDMIDQLPTETCMYPY